jgi:hypothetical protein
MCLFLICEGSTSAKEMLARMKYGCRLAAQAQFQPRRIWLSLYLHLHLQLSRSGAAGQRIWMENRIREAIFWIYEVQWNAFLCPIIATLLGKKCCVSRLRRLSQIFLVIQYLFSPLCLACYTRLVTACLSVVLLLLLREKDMLTCLKYLTAIPLWQSYSNTMSSQWVPLMVGLPMVTHLVQSLTIFGTFCVSVCLFLIYGQAKWPTKLIFDPLIQNFIAGNIG